MMIPGMVSVIKFNEGWPARGPAPPSRYTDTFTGAGVARGPETVAKGL
jgi:hypothetical protein